MPTYRKISGTTDTEFAVDAAQTSGDYFRLINLAGTASFVEPGAATNVPVRVLDDAGDAQSAMTRGAITALVGAADTVKWFKVPFTFNGGGPGNYDFTSTASFPTGSVVMGVKIAMDTQYDNGPNTMDVSAQAAGSSELASASDSDLDASGNALFVIDHALEVTFAATMNIHVRVTQAGTPTQGSGNVYVGYVETPIT
jgi:hypothetical protein